jgi:hypothetical protein
MKVKVRKSMTDRWSREIIDLSSAAARGLRPGKRVQSATFFHRGLSFVLDLWLESGLFWFWTVSHDGAIIAGGSLIPPNRVAVYDYFSADRAAVDAAWRGKGLYQAATQALVGLLGVLDSDKEQTPAADAAWRALHAEVVIGRAGKPVYRLYAPGNASK